MIKFDSVSKRYPGGHEELNNINFHLKEGEFAFLTGHSGAGKSTLLKLIMLMDKASSGQVLVYGKNLNRLSSRKLPFFRRNIGLVFQDYQLIMSGRLGLIGAWLSVIRHLKKIEPG